MKKHDRQDRLRRQDNDLIHPMYYPAAEGDYAHHVIS